MTTNGIQGSSAKLRVGQVWRRPRHLSVIKALSPRIGDSPDVQNALRLLVRVDGIQCTFPEIVALLPVDQ